MLSFQKHWISKTISWAEIRGSGKGESCLSSFSDIAWASVVFYAFNLIGNCFPLRDAEDSQRIRSLTVFSMIVQELWVSRLILCLENPGEHFNHHFSFFTTSLISRNLFSEKFPTGAAPGQHIVCKLFQKIHIEESLAASQLNSFVSILFRIMMIKMSVLSLSSCLYPNFFCCSPFDICFYARH